MRRMLSPIAPACVLALLLGAAARLASEATLRRGASEPARTVESALRLPELLALASFDLTDVRASGAGPELPHAGSAPVERLLLGEGSDREIERVLLASYAVSPGAPSPGARALVVLGRLPRDPRPGLLAQRGLDAREGFLGGERVVELSVRAGAECERRTLVVHWRPDRLALIDRPVAARVIARLGSDERSPLRVEPGALRRSGAGAVSLLLPERTGPAELARLLPALAPFPEGRALDKSMLLARAGGLPVRFVRASGCPVPRDVASPAPERALAQAGPFTVVLRELSRAPAPEALLELSGPELPGIREQLQAVELVLTRVGTAHDKESGRAPVGASWSRVLDLRGGRGDGLSAEARFAIGAGAAGGTVTALSGAVRLRVARETSVLALAPYAPGTEGSTRLVAVRLLEAGPRRFRLSASRGGERIVDVRAFDAEGRALPLASARVEPGPPGWTAELEPAGGPPARLELRVAERLERADYAFRLSRGGS